MLPRATRGTAPGLLTPPRAELPTAAHAAALRTDEGDSHADKRGTPLQPRGERGPFPEAVTGQRVLGAAWVHLLEKSVIRPSGRDVSGCGAIGTEDEGHWARFQSVDGTVGPSTRHPWSEATLSCPQVQTVPRTCLPSGEGRKAAPLPPGRAGRQSARPPPVGALGNPRPRPAPGTAEPRDLFTWADGAPVGTCTP